MNFRKDNYIKTLKNLIYYLTSIYLSTYSVMCTNLSEFNCCNNQNSKSLLRYNLSSVGV